jgi:hypothetical protein
MNHYDKNYKIIINPRRTKIEKLHKELKVIRSVPLNCKYIVGHEKETCFPFNALFPFCVFWHNIQHEMCEESGI